MDTTTLAVAAQQEFGKVNWLSPNAGNDFQRLIDLYAALLKRMLASEPTTPLITLPIGRIGPEGTENSTYYIMVANNVNRANADQTFALVRALLPEVGNELETRIVVFVVDGSFDLLSIPNVASQVNGLIRQAAGRKALFQAVLLGRNELISIITSLVGAIQKRAIHLYQSPAVPANWGKFLLQLAIVNPR